MFKTKIPVIIISLLVMAVHSCEANYELENIETGIVNFQNTNRDNTLTVRNFTYTYFTQFQSVPQLAFGNFGFDSAINNFQSRNIELPSFYISVLGKNTTKTQFTMVNYQNWNLITINFVITLRKDIYLDSVRYQVENPFYLFKIQVQTGIRHTRAVARVFLNGIHLKQPLQKMKQQKFGIQLSFNSLAQTFMVASLSGSSLLQTKTIWFSYLIFSPEDAGFASYGGRIHKQGYKGIQNYNLHQIVYRSQYRIFGITGIQLLNQSIGLISSITSNFVGTIYSSTFIPSLTINYVVFGNVPRKMCNCPNGANKYAYDRQCLSQCPQDTYLHQYNDGAFSCLSCSQSFNMKINANKTKCQCRQGFELNLQSLTCLLRPIISRSLPANLTSQQKMILPEKNLSSQPVISTNLNLANSVSTGPTQSSSPAVLVSNVCLSMIANSYFDGSQCYCKSGFRNVSNACVPANEFAFEQKILSAIPLFLLNNRQIVNNCNQVNQIIVNGVCECRTDYQRVNGACLSKSNFSVACGTGQYFNGQQCICLNGFRRMDVNLCIQDNNSLVSCLQNQFDNGLGICICRSGLFNFNGSCVTDRPCTLNSIRLINGTCSCINGFFNISGECSRCLPGQYWLQTDKKCIFSCGQNAFYNSSSKKCQCVAFYGIFSQNKCQYCVSQQNYILNNYCVQCMINQVYSPNLNRCTCKQGFFIQKNGQCSSKCPKNEYFDSSFQSCKCSLSLGRFNGVCQICPANYFTNSLTQQCTLCKVNQIYSDRKCSCKDGFAPTNSGLCVPCGQIYNAFLFRGKCATCPGQKIYNGSICKCPSGTFSRGSKCIVPCKTDELFDSSGNCYQCPVNQVVFNDRCECIKNYIRVNGICQLSCPVGSFKFQGRCAVCPSDRYFNQQISGCVCQDGFYLNTYNQCQKYLVSTISCPVGRYLNQNYECLSCPENCDSCTNNSVCLKCLDSYRFINGFCEDPCGNGIVSSFEQCDDRNIISGDGCSSFCRIQTNYKCSGTPSICVSLLNRKCGNGVISTTQQCDDSNSLNGDGCSSVCATEYKYQCFGQPSVCRYNPNFHQCANGYVETTQLCDDKNFINGDGCDQNCLVESNFRCSGQPSVCQMDSAKSSLKVFGQIRYNINNIFIVLQAAEKFNFESQKQMQNFIKTSFSIPERPTTYCLQKQAPQLDFFDCLLIYSSGVPNRSFTAEFSYTYNNSNVAKLLVNIDPLSFQMEKVRNLRRLYQNA